MANVFYHTSDAVDDKLDPASIQLPSNGGRILITDGDIVVLVTKRMYYDLKVRPYDGDGSASSGNIFYKPYDGDLEFSGLNLGSQNDPAVMLALGGDDVLLRTSLESNRIPAWILATSAQCQIEIRPRFAHQ